MYFSLAKLLLRHFSGLEVFRQATYQLCSISDQLPEVLLLVQRPLGLLLQTRVTLAGGPILSSYCQISHVVVQICRC